MIQASHYSVMPYKQHGHTLVELLIAMVLALLTTTGLIAAAGLGLKAVKQQGLIQTVSHELSQSLRLIHTDIANSGMTGCLLYKSSIYDQLFDPGGGNSLPPYWLSSWDANAQHWYPQRPYFDNASIDVNHDAIRLLFADLSQPLSAADLNRKPQRIVYATHCGAAEIRRAAASGVIGAASSNPAFIYPFQSVLYYLKDNGPTHTLYRQYLTQTGRTRNEPLIDHIESLRIAFGEKTDGATLQFRPASAVNNWRDIAAVYIRLELMVQQSLYSIASVIELPNAG